MKNQERLLRVACFALCFLCLSAARPLLANANQDLRPNIILLLTDDQRDDTLGCAGHAIVQTPHIDRLAARGVRFENSFVTTSICAASRASIFTGLHERTHGYTFGKPAVKGDYTLASYPSLLRRSGYRTGFIGKFGVRMQGSQAMFEFNKPVPGPGYIEQADGSRRESTDVMGDLAQQFLKKDDDRPFCLSVSFHASHAKDGDKTPGMGHYPYPEGVKDLYGDQAMPLPNLSDSKYFESLPDFLKTSMNRERFFWRWDTPEKYQVNMRAYLRMLSGIDRVVGRLKETLEQEGLAENTVIIYTADNGYYMADRGLAGKWSHFEQSLRVPLIVYDPRLPDNRQGQLVQSMALNIDLAPTMLELANLRVPEHYQGRSLTSLVSKGAEDTSSRDTIFCEHLMDNALIPKWQGVRTPRYKYARYFEQTPAFEFLHDLEADPTEFKNLASDPDYHEVLVQMRAKTEELAASYSQALIAEDLRCESRVNPLGIDELKPRLGWALRSQVRDQAQTAYQLIVSSSLEEIGGNRGELWDSGKVESNQSLQMVYGGKALASSTRYYWKVRAWDKNDRAGQWSQVAWFETALLNQRDWQAAWINDGKANPVTDEGFYKIDPAPLFRKEFALAKPVKQARLYITGLGYYEASLNGQRIGDHVLDPGWTKVSERAYYSTFDVTDRLKAGVNCLGVTLGNGWYNPLPLRMWGHKNIREFLPVGRPRFISQLRIVYQDGSVETVLSDESWKVTQGPILRNSIYLGELYDAREEIEAWDEPGINDSGWPNASLAEESLGELQAQPLEPIRVTATIKPIGITEPEQGVHIIDMGQNFSGWASFNFNLPRGTQVNIRYGELLQKDGTLNPMTSVCGQIKGKPSHSLEAHPGVAWQEDVYIAKGDGPELYTPRFTFHAFRYIEITGSPLPPTLDMVTGLRLNSDVKPVGRFACSNGMFNDIQEICDWTFLSNIFSVQSDCPHRERFGYGGDLVNTNEAFMFNYDMSSFYAKAVTDWDDSKLQDGMLTDTAPSVGIQYCGVGWAMAHPQTQLKLYQYYGDKRIIERQYRTSKQWLDLVIKKNPDHIVKNGLSDHESLAEKPPAPMVTPLYYQSARMLAKMARILGRDAESKQYDALAQSTKAAYNAQFVDAASGRCSPGTQASQSFALFSDILSEAQRPRALNFLLKDIDEHDSHLTTGIFGTRYMLELLSVWGHTETAYRIVNQTTFPGWGHMLENGATTLWEHWEFSDNTFSHNHPMFGSVSQWFYNWLGGIQAHPDAIGFDHIIIRPQIPKDLQWVNCSYDSVRGKITSHWRKTDRAVILDIELPANTTADVYLPCGHPEAIRENNMPVGQVPGIQFERGDKNTSVYRVPSGRYQFSWPHPE